MKKYILRDVTVIDGKGNEPFEHKAIAVDGKKIEWIRDKDDIQTDDEYRILDLCGMVVMPGLIDAHMHLCGGAGDRISAFALNQVVRDLKAVVQSQETMSYGVTAVRDISPIGLYLKRVIARGELTGPRIIACGQGLVRSGGHADLSELPFEMVAGQHSWMSNHYWGIVADGEAEIRKTIRLMLREGADQIKFWASGGGYSTVDAIHDTHYSLEECRVIAEESRLVNNIPLVSHAESLESIRNSIEINVHSIEHGDELDEECAELMTKKNIYFVPTLNLVANWYIDRFGDKRVEPTHIAIEYGPFRSVEHMKDEPVDGLRVRDQMYDMFKMALEKGVKIALGSDTVRDKTTKYGEYTIRELITLVEAGMTPLEGIKAATQTAAEVLKLDKYIGTIESGKIADMIVLKANPLDSLDVLMDKSNIKYVIQDGKIKIEDGMMHNFGDRWED